MSNATIIQLYDRVFIASDSAVSTKLGDKIYRIEDKGRKLFVVDDKVIFCSGNMDLSYLVMGYYHVNEDKSINSLAMIAKELFGIYARGEFALDIMVCTIENDKSTVYLISPYNDFEIVKQELSHPEQYAIWTGGIKTKESFDIAHQMLLSGSSIKEIYRQVFSRISYEGVGGTLTAYGLTSQGISKIVEEQIVENKYERLDINQLSHANLIVGEYVYGTLGAFAKVTASSIVVGTDNVKLPDSVISSSSNWNGIYDKTVQYSDANLQAAKVYSDNTLVSANGHANQINSAIRNDLRLTAPLPTNLSLNASGITATTSDPTKFARLDYRGLYIQNGALQITSTDGTTVIDGSGVNASKIYTGSLNGIHMTIGTGNSVFKADSNGIYLGSTVFAAAPFRVDMSGNVTANNITLSGTINSSTMNNSHLKGGSLDIGNGMFRVDSLGNITIQSGTISWGGGINSDPSIATAQYIANNAQTAANGAQGTANTALTTAQQIANGTYKGGTFISDKVIYSPDLRGGSITSNTKITVGTDLHVGDNIYLNQAHGIEQSIVSKGNGNITFRRDAMVIAADQQINFEVSNLTWAGAKIATESWVNNSVIARFG